MNKKKDQFCGMEKQRDHGRRHVKDKARAWRAILGLALHPGSLDRIISRAVFSTLLVVSDTAWLEPCLIFLWKVLTSREHAEY